MEREVTSFQEIETVDTQSNVHVNDRHFGATIPIKWREDGEPKYVLGPHYMVFLVTLLLTTIIFGWMGYNIASSTKGKKIQISFAITFSLAFYIYSYIKVGFSNPGIASTNQQLDQQSRKNHKYCYPCKLIRPPRTVHCYSCDVCIYGYDHHCPWIGKCVGTDNMCDFRMFLLSIVTALIVFGVCIFTAGSYEQKKTSI